jgi:hypothetical protein
MNGEMTKKLYEAWRDAEPPMSYSQVAGLFPGANRNMVAGAVGRMRKHADGHPVSEHGAWVWAGRKR